MVSLINDHLRPALARGQTGTVATVELERTLAAAVLEVNQGVSRIRPDAEPRMVPSVAPLGVPVPFTP